MLHQFRNLVADGLRNPSPLINDRCAELNFTNEGGVFGSTRLLKNIGGLWIFQQIRKALERRGEEESWETMVAKAEDAKPFSMLVNPDAEDFRGSNGHGRRD